MSRTADKTVVIDFTQPLQGLRHAEDRLNLAASRIARLTNVADSVDLSAEIVSLTLARNSFSANAKVVRSEDELTRSLLDLNA